MARDDPRVLFAVHGIRAYHIQDGEESSLTPSGPQTLSLLMVSTASPFADLSTTTPQNEIPDEDFYLHLHLPPELDLPLPATTQIYHQPPRSYLIPRWDLPERGAFTRIEFPPIGDRANNVTQEDVDTFETILAQCTAFLERATPPSTEKGAKAYHPADFRAGEGYVSSASGMQPGKIVLIDEDDGSVVGELGEGASIVEDSKLKAGSKDPVEIQMSQDGKRVDVRPISEDYLKMARHPAYKDSSMVQNAAAASRLIVTGSSYLGNILTSGADSFAQKTKPSPKPLSFSPSAHARVRRLNSITQSAAGVSAKTVGQASDIAQNLSARLAGHKRDRYHKGFGNDGKVDQSYKPGFLNKSMIAFSTVADGIAQSGRELLTQSGAAATTVVAHRYGQEAGSLAAELSGGFKNVGLVYIDVTGVSRRAIIKSVAKGMVVGKVKGGGEVVVGGGDGGVVPDSDLRHGGVTNDNLGQGQTAGSSSKEPGLVGFGNQATAPPDYTASTVGEPMGSSALQGQEVPRKF